MTGETESSKRRRQFWKDCFMLENKRFQELQEEYLIKKAQLNVAEQALIKLDKWQGKQSCNASVYEVTDDEFSDLQFIIHDAFAKIEEFSK